MPISKVTLPDNSTQDIKDSRLPDPASNLNGRALIISSGGAWQVGFPAGFKYIDDIRIINTTSFPLYRYKICGFNRYGRLMPLTVTDQTSTTIVDKTVLTQSIDPQRGLVYYGAETNVTDTSTKIGDLYPERSMIYANYTFNSALPTYSEIFLKGTYDGHMFKLDNSTLTSWYVSAPVNSSQANYFAVFTSGSYYMLVGNTGGTSARLNLKLNNPLFYFDGTYLVQVNLDTKVQPLLVSGTNIKTINSTSLLGSGDVAVQATLVSGTNIKTVNNTSLLGSGDLSVGTYSKPSGGIPSSDMTTAVQTSLGKADTIPSVSASDKQKLLAIDDNGNIVATFSVGGQGISHLISNLQTISLVGFDYNDFSFIKPSDVNTTLQDALDAKPDVYSGSSAPSSSLGKNGDIYIKLSS